MSCSSPQASLVTMAVATLLLVCCVTAVYGAECSGKPDPNALPNYNPIDVGAPVFNSSAENGKLYTVGGGVNGTTLRILHVYGTPYEQGFAQGTLLKEALTGFYDNLWDYLEEQVEEAVPKLPAWLAQILANYGLEAALQATADITAKYTGDYFFEELRGISDASGVSYSRMLQIHMIGELTKGGCSMYGAWGNATTAEEPLLQLRALDWDVDGPYKDYPMITVYHPVNSSYGHTFANIGFVGWIGSVSGMSSTQMGISEIGVTFPDASFGKESRFGTPFTFLLRDILQWDETLDDSIDRITTAHRTCDLILGVGDAKLGEFRGFEYSASVANVIDDVNLIPVNDTWHPKIPEVVYFGMDWLCPAYNEALAHQLQKFHGNITALNTIKYITAQVTTGDLQCSVYDLSNQFLYVSYAAGTNATGPAMGYQRQFVKVDMNLLWAETL
eukprot:TRINITY_DN1136_c1_g1_i1.p1 TRINITY_DN1136_c1_g1~~TRINITY_DN1136_c1_g1_i1.p1  ORF type:complete len:445 (+),score=107.23 TRINITY_DN1136_c1_g1_i1:158-1492(+)